MARKPRRRVRARAWWLLALVAAAAIAIIRGLAPTQTSHPAARLAAPPTPTASPALYRWRRLTWQLPKPLEGLAAAPAASGIAVAGGLSSTATLDEVWVLGPNGVIHQATLPRPVHDAAAVSVGDTLWVFGGGVSTSENLVQRVPLGSSPAGPSPSPSLFSMPQALSDLAAVRIGNYAYLIGGHDQGAPLNTVWRYDLASQEARPFAHLPQGVRYAAAAAGDGRLWVVGGQTSTGLSRAVWTVDPSTGTVSSGPPLPSGLEYASAVWFAHALWVVGGKTAAGWTNQTWVYTPGTAGFQPGPALPEPTGYGAAVANGGRLWWIGGVRQDQPSASLFVLEPVKK